MGIQWVKSKVGVDILLSPKVQIAMQDKVHIFAILTNLKFISTKNYCHMHICLYCFRMLNTCYGHTGNEDTHVTLMEIKLILANYLRLNLVIFGSFFILGYRARNKPLHGISSSSCLYLQTGRINNLNLIQKDEQLGCKL